MVIALWCGNPTTTNRGLSANYSTQQVNDCRKELFECTAKSPTGTGFLQCFKERKLY